MSTKLRKSKRKNLAESTSSDEQSDDDSDNAGFKKSSRANKQKKKYCESLSNLCDDSSSDKEGQKLYKSRSASRLANSKTQNESIVIDLSDSASESAGKSNAKESKAKRRRKSSSESSFESFKKEQKSSKKLLAKIKKKKVDDNDSSFSTELQQPQRKKMKSILAKSFEKYDLNDQSVVNTPSRAEEEKLPVESAQEISFKHYVIQEIKKFQEMSNKLQEDLQLNNDYLLKKKINTVCDAKFFIHKILKLYESTCSQFRENRREFTKIYEGWMNEVSKKPKEAEGKKRFNLTTDESDAEINNITKNGKISPQKQKKQEEDNKRSRDNSIEPKDDESRLKGPKQSKLKLKNNNSSRASCSKIVAQASDVDDSPMQASGCDSEVIFSSEETKSKRKSKIAEKETTGAGVSDEKVTASKEKTTANTQEKAVASSNSDSEDLFDTSTGEVASTPVRSIVAPTVPIPPPPDHDANEVDEEMAEVAEVDEEMAEVAEVAEVAKVVGEVAEEADEMAEEVEEQPAARKSGKQGGLEVEDPKELQALRELMDDDDSSDSSGLEADVEDVADDKDEPQTKNTSGSSKPEALPAKAKILRKQTKKRSLIYSDSSSSDEAQETLARPKGRAARNKSATEDQQASASLRTAPRQKGTFELLRNNRFYLADEKLRRRCRVALERLPKATLAKYAAALEKSKNYVERKKIQSLANLDNLEKKKKKNKTRGDAGSLDTDLQEPPKKSKAKDEKKSVVDYLGKASGEVDSGDESSGEKDNGENHSAPTADDDEQNQHDSESNAKEALLRESSSSSSSSDEQVNDSTIADEDSKKQKVTQAKGKKKGKKSNDGSGQDEEEEKENEEEKDDDDDETDKMKEKSDWRKDKLLNFKLDGSDTEEEKFEKSQEKKKAKQSDNSENDKEEEDKSSSPLKKVKNAKKSRKTRRILDSDSDAQSPSEDDANENSSDADEQQEEQSSDQEKDKQDKNNKKRRRRKQSSDSDSQSDGKKPKSKRRRIKKVASDSEDSDADSPGKGRKNIRKVLKDKYVTDDTKKAAQEEEERLKRIADRQKLFNDMYEKRLAGEEKVEKLVLDIDEETKEELVVVDKELAKRLKPHQARGIKFMWDACYESIDQIEKSEGSGCIIAHCMGLGKTFQVVTLAHTLLTHEKTGVRTVMIVCPLSTVLNWANEFNMWLKHVKNSDEIEIFEMTKLKKNIERKCTLENWRNYGGVLIIGYEMFRNLTSTGKKMRKNMQESIMKSLVDPGADLVVCDEGHLLKNEDSALSKAMRLVKTMRRIVLTGTPLQNNLKEYHCMVQFVKPNLLGTKKEFLNRFVNPITNGQFDDSTPYDVKLMKKRAHVLHKMLEGSVQRFDYNVLTPFLPPKQEYVMFVRLTEVQIKMYRHYLDNFARRLGGRNVTLFADFQALQRIWTHPYVMMLNAEKTERANEKKRLEASDSEGSLKDFIDDDSTSESESDSEASSNSSDVECLDSGSEKAVRKRGTRANPVKEEEPEAEAEEETAEETAWWSQFVDEQQHFNDLRVSTKLMLLFAILKESESIGDKVLVFSQSLYSLTLIEHFLNLMDEANQQGADAENLDGHTGSWSLGIDYFRLDGSTSAENRSIWSKIFNNPKNTRARLFLISTRAGGLGINLIGANRVIIFDASWNPSHDVQSIFRIYRFGQKKPCYVYRFLAAGTMEEKIYNRQVTKLSLACRVVDEQQIERHYSNTDLAELYQFDTCEDQSETLSLPKDRLLAEIFIKYKDSIVKCHEHDSLLENKEEEELDEEERKQAWAEYEEEKKGIRQQYSNVGGNNFVFNQMLMNMNVMPEFQGVKQLLQKDYPDVPPEHLDVLARQAMYDMYRMVDQQAALGVPSNFGVAQQNPYGTSSTIQQEAIMNQQSRLMNPQQPVQANYFPVNQMPVYSGRGRPPKFTSVNNQIVNNPMYMANAQALQHPVPNDNEIQILDDESSTVSSNKEANN